MSAEELARALGGRRVGSTWMATCPSHRDRDPSLAIGEKDGRLLVYCHAGCHQRDVVQALKARGLWPERTGRKWREWQDGIRYPTDWGVPVCAYDYRDAAGAFLYSVVRFEPKSFRPGYFDDSGRWIWKKHPKQVLYRLREVLEAPIVFVVEGERDCETLRDWGFVATTNSGGAKASWLSEYTEVLKGREVILIPDNDAPGRKRVLNIARALLGKVARLVVLELEGGSKDVTEWFSQGHSELELIAQLDGEEVSL